MADFNANSVAARFWEAIANGDPVGASWAAEELHETPFVASPTFSFPDEPFSGLGRETVAEEGEIFLSPRNVEPDTPQATVEAWNKPGKVGFVVVTWNADGTVDFFACGLEKDACTTFTHKGTAVVSAILPDDDLGALAVEVVRTSKNVKAKYFSRPLVPLALIPEPCRNEQRMSIVLSLKHPSRVMKVLLENYVGYQQMELFMGGARPEVAQRPTLPPAITIPSPRVGVGGLRESEFEDRSPSRQSLSNSHATPGADHAGHMHRPVSPAGGAANTVFGGVGFGARPSSRYFHREADFGDRLSVASSGHYEAEAAFVTQSEAASMKEMIRKLQRRVNTSEAHLTELFNGVREEMDELWNEVTEARSKAASAVSDAYEAKLTAEAAEAAGAHQVRGSVIGEGRFQPMDYDDTVDFRRSVAAQVLRDMDAGEFVSEQRLREIMAELATQEA